MRLQETVRSECQDRRDGRSIIYLGISPAGEAADECVSALQIGFPSAQPALVRLAADSAWSRGLSLSSRSVPALTCVTCRELGLSPCGLVSKLPWPPRWLAGFHISPLPPTFCDVLISSFSLLPYRRCPRAIVHQLRPCTHQDPVHTGSTATARLAATN